MLPSGQWDLDSSEPHGLFKSLFAGGNDEWHIEHQSRLVTWSQIPPNIVAPAPILKNAFRTGLPHQLRRKWWLIGSGGYKLLSEFGDVWQFIIKKPPHEVFAPSSTNRILCELAKIAPEVTNQLDRFLGYVLAQNRSIELTPLIPMIACSLLMYLEPPLAYASIQAMINRSKEDTWYFILNHNQAYASIKALNGILSSRCAQLVHHARKFGIDIAQLTFSLFLVFFIPFTTPNAALTFIDSFMLEGRKVLLRFSLNLLFEEKHRLLDATNAEEFYRVISNAVERINDVQIMKRFLKNSFKLFLSRDKHLKVFQSKQTSDELAVVHASIEFDPGKHIKYQSFSQIQSTVVSSIAPPTDVSKGRLLDELLLFQIRNYLPSLYRRYSTKLLFSTERDGISISTLFRSSFNAGSPHILLIETGNSLIGALLSNGFEQNHYYYGKAMCSVFKKDGNSIDFYRATRENDYFMWSDPKSIMIGGPKAAIFFVDGLKVVISDPCRTFGSPSLTGKRKGVTVKCVELYVLSSPHSGLSLEGEI